MKKNTSHIFGAIKLNLTTIRALSHVITSGGARPTAATCVNCPSKYEDGAVCGERNR